MDLGLLFRLANASVIPFWLMLLLAPRSAWTFRVVQRPWMFLALAMLYGLLLAMAPPGASEAGMGSLSGVSLLFQNPTVLLAGWVHYLVFDLFVGAWITRDAVKNEFSQPLLIPILLLTLMLGPLGLGSYLLLRWWLRGGTEL